VRGRVDAGFELVDVQTAQVAMMYRVNAAGVYIASSSDERFVAGDRITNVDGFAVSNMMDYNNALRQRSIGDVVSITVSRGNQEMTFDVNLVEWKP